MARGELTPDQLAADLDSQELTRKCLELRLAGGTLDSIGRVVGLDKSNVSRRIKRALASIPKSEAAELRKLEDERLDVMLTSIWRQVREGHLGAVDRALRVSERRARLHGLDAPQRVDLSSKPVDIDGVARDIMAAMQAPGEAEGDEPPEGGGHE